ncbi:MAG TPA: hypothetical protein VGM78_04905 [Ilumatobacteraceae bacterium]|jgi:hypothetical protein
MSNIPSSPLGDRPEPTQATGERLESAPEIDPHEHEERGWWSRLLHPSRDRP